jgi:diguanylate cyclase (GGDEF)-like protein
MRLSRHGGRARAALLPATRRPAPWLLLALPLALAGIFVADRATAAAPIQHLYYLPIVCAAVWFGGRGSVLVSSAAVLLYHAANPPLISAPYKDTDLVQIVLFFAVGLAAARVAHDTRQLQQLASTDDLTGLHNLRSFEARLTAALKSTGRDGRPLALLVLDVDRLKSLNDVHGHLAGGDAVRAVGRVLAERLPDDACACRYGGDEFVVALPGFVARDAAHVADDLRRSINALAPNLAGHSFPVGTLSISVGVAALQAGGKRAPDQAAALGESLFRAADAALYEAKRHGRNQVASTASISAA